MLSELPRHVAVRG